MKGKKTSSLKSPFTKIRKFHENIQITQYTSKYAYTTMQFNDEDNHQKNKHFYPEKKRCYVLLLYYIRGGQISF